LPPCRNKNKPHIDVYRLLRGNLCLGSVRQQLAVLNMENSNFGDLNALNKEIATIGGL